ncbi:MAG: AAA family ATPase [Desulfobacter sp.]
MRILQVRFKNLNSLAGEWEIDLTQPAYTADGIFGITGPTGAGKTTILDAICLALYGRTPRLTKVTKSGNEIMSRQTGECFAEVTFETQVGRFRCHWSQHRSRKKSDGELQAPKHEIANADTGEIFESKMRGVADHIESVTGMDFDRFTRSMLLAQGGFAAFLQAAPDERAPILEQITGTKIYSQISIRVHERRSHERKQLEILQAALAGMQLLTQEEEQQLAEGLDLKEKQDAEFTIQLSQKNMAISWFEGIARLEDDLKALGLLKSELLIKVEAFAPEQERLRLANQALELSAEYAALNAIRKEQAADQSTLGECQESLPGCTDASKQAEDAMKTAADQLAARKTDQQTFLPIIRKVRELDLKIVEKDSPIKVATDSISEQSTSLKTLKAKQKNDSEDLTKYREALKEFQSLLTASQVDETLVEHLAGLHSRFDALKTLSNQLTAKQNEITQAETQLNQTVSSWQELSTFLNNDREALGKNQLALAEKQADLLKILDDKDVAAWRKLQSAISVQKDLISKALVAVESLAKSQQASSQLENRQTSLRQQELTLTSKLGTLSEKQVTLEKDVGLLETQLTLLKRIEALEEARHQLQDGEACPLCGAKEHPFAEGNIPAPDETQQRLSTVRDEHKSVTGEISDLKVRVAQVNKDLEQTATALKEHAEKIGEAIQAININCAEIDSKPKLTTTDSELSEKLIHLQEENSSQYIRATGILEVADSIENELATLRDSLEKAKDSASKCELEVQAAAHTKESAEQLLDRLKKEAAEYLENQSKSLDTLQNELEPYSISAISVETIDTANEQLTARRDVWVSRNKQRSEIEQKIAALEIQVGHQAEQILKAEGDINKQQELLTELLRDQDALRSERRDLFEDKKTDEEEKRFSDVIEAADKNLEAARQVSSTANQALSKLKFNIDELVKSINARDLKLKTADASFLSRLKSYGFVDEANYQSSCLNESERKELSLQAQTLADKKNEIASKEREKTLSLETERQKNISEEPLEDLKNAVSALSGAQRDIQQEIGGIRQKLKDDDLLKQQQQEWVQAIDAQKRECARWDLLHELIGSADGKKYRNFAQGLTFEMMVGHANRQLQKMSDRYLLIRDDNLPLELNVMDNYQAGEIRSTKNLSGGESFIVSLSLALGLSHMASKNVRVDSLFLDEGFGTLDEEALDTALETLSGLQQDGKLIGVISHVPALKERISTQIQVTHNTGGRSSISGPGCRRVSL